MVAATVASTCPPEVFPEEWDLEGLLTALLGGLPGADHQVSSCGDAGDVRGAPGAFVEDVLAAYEAKEARSRRAVMRELERMVLLNIIDTSWREHLYEMDYLQEGIHLRAYAQRDPITEYRREAFDMFEELTSTIQTEFVRYIYRVELVNPEQQQPAGLRAQGEPGRGRKPRGRGRGGRIRHRAGVEPEPGISDKVPTERPCPCGSGRKYKKCHGAVA